MHGQVTCPWELDSIAVRVEDAGAGLRFSSGALSYRKTPTILSKRALAEISRARHGRRAQRHTLMRFLFIRRIFLSLAGLLLPASAFVYPLDSRAQTEPAAEPDPRPAIVREDAPTLEEVVVTGQASEEDQPTPRRNQERRPKREPCFWKHLKLFPWSRASSSKTKESRIWRAP